MDPSRPLCACWIAARNSAALRAFLFFLPSLIFFLASPSQTCTALLGSLNTQGLFFPPSSPYLLRLDALVRRLIAQRILQSTALYVICRRARGLGVTLHSGTQQRFGVLELEWLLNNLATAFFSGSSALHT